jgi:hypothetical protein
MSTKQPKQRRRSKPTVFPIAQPITVHVTQQDIDNSERCSRTRCMLAVAIARRHAVLEAAGAFKGRPPGRIRVTAAGVTVAIDRYRFTSRLPQEAVRALCDYDAGRAVKPFVFRLQFNDPPRKITPVDPARMEQIQVARRMKIAERIALGLPGEVIRHGRFVI